MRLIFYSSLDCEQRNLVVRLSCDEFDAFRERYVDARGTIHAFYNDLSVEEETCNTLQYEDRHDESGQTMIVDLRSRLRAFSLHFQSKVSSRNRENIGPGILFSVPRPIRTPLQ